MQSQLNYMSGRDRPSGMLRAAERERLTRAVLASQGGQPRPARSTRRAARYWRRLALLLVARTDTPEPTA
jgi:hypothetical protein